MPHATGTASTSLLMWGGAPGTDAASTDHDDTPVFALSSQTDDDPDPSEHADC